MYLIRSLFQALLKYSVHLNAENIIKRIRLNFYQKRLDNDTVKVAEKAVEKACKLRKKSVEARMKWLSASCVKRLLGMFFIMKQCSMGGMPM